MKNIRIFVITLASAATLGMAGCASRPSNSQIGTGVGAVAGGLVGNAVFGSTLGTGELRKLADHAIERG